MTLFQLPPTFFPETAITRAELNYQLRSAKRPRAWRRWLNRIFMGLVTTLLFFVFATLLLVMLGGAWVPTFVFPEWLQTVSLFVPTRWAIDGLAAMTWRGLDIEAALAPMGVMIVTSAAMFALAIWRFRWEE